MFTSIDLFDYGELIRSYTNFCSDKKLDASIDECKSMLLIANRIVHKKVSSYDMFPEIVSLSEMFRERTIQDD
jgi:hypothetical protein